MSQKATPKTGKEEKQKLISSSDWHKWLWLEIQQYAIYHGKCP